MLTRNAQDTVKDLQGKVGGLEGEVAETRDKQAALEQVYRDLMRNRDDWEIAEIQQLLTNAGQQLQFTGNVQVALAALRKRRRAHGAYRQAAVQPAAPGLARDIARMKAVPDTDLTGAAIKLDEAINQSTRCRCCRARRMLERSETDARKAARKAAKDGGPGGPATPAQQAGHAIAGWFGGLWGDLREELASVVQVRRVDDAEALLLSGDRAGSCARTSSCACSTRAWPCCRATNRCSATTAAAQAMIARYFDGHARRVQGVQTLLKQAQAGAVTVQLPTMADSLGALHALKKE